MLNYLFLKHINYYSNCIMRLKIKDGDDLFGRLEILKQYLSYVSSIRCWKSLAKIIAAELLWFRWCAQLISIIVL